MSVPAGYKMTEAGVIPQEWEVRKLREVIDFLDGRRKPVKDSDRAQMRGDYPYYGASGIVDYVNGYLFDDDLILLGEDGENIISRNCPLAFRVTGKIWVNNHAHVLKPKSGCDIGYLTEYLESLNYEQFNSGTAQPKLNKFACSNIVVAFPPLPEQQAIAEALGDVDALLGSLDKLLAKKRDLKQAAMQELLTGKTRLPGFAGKWEEKTLGDVVEKVGSGITPTGGESVYKTDGRPFVRSQNVGVGSLLLQDMAFIDEQTHQSFVSTQIVEGDVFLNITGASIGRSAVADHRVLHGNVNQHVCIVRPTQSKLNYRFLNMLLLSDLGQNQIDSFQAGGNRQGLNFGQIRSFSFDFPLFAEQTAIAEVLSDMDAEITAVEERRAKTRDLKTGMMQELLMGKTRLR